MEDISLTNPNLADSVLFQLNSALAKLQENSSNLYESLQSKLSNSESSVQALIFFEIISLLPDLLKIPSKSSIKQLKLYLQSQKIQSSQEFKIPIWPELFSLNSFSLNIFDFALENIFPLVTFTYEIFEYWGLFNTLSIIPSKLLDFALQINTGYKDIPYHNALHAADVLQSCHIIMNSADFPRHIVFGPIDKAMLFVSAIIHDFKHPGVNNIYLSAISHKFAIRYNDMSVLENFHLAQAFKVFQKVNIFEGVCDLKTIKKRIVKCVLDTDMSIHSKHQIETQQCAKDKNMFGIEFYASMYLHAADISNLCRDFQISEQWAVRIREEMKRQAELEEIAGISIGYQCEKSMAYHQFRFIDYIMPYYDALADIQIVFSYWAENLKRNQIMWGLQQDN